jgi:hypothetical protein
MVPAVDIREQFPHFVQRKPELLEFFGEADSVHGAHRIVAVAGCLPGWRRHQASALVEAHGIDRDIGQPSYFTNFQRANLT